MTTYYRITDDLHLNGRWHLGDVCNDEGFVDNEFTMGRPAQIRSRPIVELQYPGVPLDFSLTAFNVPVVSVRFAETVKPVVGDDVEFISAQVGDRPGYEIMNTLRLIECIDESRSEFIKWTEKDHRADLAGQYRAVPKLKIASERIPSNINIFRIKYWEVVIVVSDVFVEAARSIAAVGMRLKPLD
jgi:hypothetical protein